MNRHTVLAFMQDRPGVLNKVAMVMRRKMYNIDTLTVCASEKPGISRMTITLVADDASKVQHIIKQIKKIPEVVEIKELDREESFWREVALLKCSLLPSKLEYLKETYKFEILSQKESETILQICGTVRRIDAFIGEVGMKNILEVARSGVTAMEA